MGNPGPASGPCAQAQTRWVRPTSCMARAVQDCCAPKRRTLNLDEGPALLPPWPQPSRPSQLPPVTLGLRAPRPHTGHGRTLDPSRTSCSPLRTVTGVSLGAGGRAEQTAAHWPSQRSRAQ